MWLTSSRKIDRGRAPGSQALRNYYGAETSITPRSSRACRVDPRSGVLQGQALEGGGRYELGAAERGQGELDGEEARGERRRPLRYRFVTEVGPPLSFGS